MHVCPLLCIFVSAERYTITQRRQADTLGSVRPPCVVPTCATSQPRITRTRKSGAYATDALRHLYT